ncbi:MAG TPA: tRNA (guanine(10)-N(2))-dimethyltransferase [Nitrososphaeraceae archaeon]|jgi:tRNA (guanine26-N2/guanine27-N2)-dimethyltransferase
MLTSSISEILEGGTRLLVPNTSLTEKIPPKVPAFFNPVAKRNRDISILVYSAFSELDSLKSLTFADSLCGVGSRGLRVGVEIPSSQEIWMNDINPNALELAKESAKLNSIINKCHFHNGEACSFLLSNQNHERKRYDIVDLDPFGSPSPYIDCVLRAVKNGGLLSVTATDTAVLCGVYPHVCFRKYLGYPINNEYANETGIRLLISLIAFTASRFDLAINPLFSHTNLHFMRTYLQIKISNNQANNIHTKIGNILHCHKCGNRTQLALGDCSKSCSICLSKCSLGGPLWKGPLSDTQFLKIMLNLVPRLTTYQQSPNLQKSIINQLEVTAKEIPEPYYYLVDTISSKLKISPPPISEVIERIHDSGFSASRAALNPRGIKTVASITEILHALKNRN